MACEFLAAISELPAGDPATWRFENQNNKELTLKLDSTDKAPEYWLTARKSNDGVGCEVEVKKRPVIRSESPQPVNDSDIPQPTVLAKAYLDIHDPSLTPSSTDLRIALQESFKYDGERVHFRVGLIRRRDEKFLTSIPAPSALTCEVQQWLHMWFEQRGIPVTPFQEAISKIPWDGCDIRERSYPDLECRLGALGFKLYSDDIACDIYKARSPEQKSWVRIGCEIAVAVLATLIAVPFICLLLWKIWKFEYSF